MDAVYPRDFFNCVHCVDRHDRLRHARDVDWLIHSGVLFYKRPHCAEDGE